MYDMRKPYKTKDLKGFQRFAMKTSLRDGWIKEKQSRVQLATFDTFREYFGRFTTSFTVKIHKTEELISIFTHVRRF